MKVITIQNKVILDILNKEGIYKASYNRVSDNLIKPYKALAKEYGYNTCPIFVGVIGKYCEFYGATLENSVAIELNIPDNEIRLQDYYNWVDAIYFMEDNDFIKAEFNEVFDLSKVPNIETYTKMVLNGPIENHRAVQGTIPYIKQEWISNILYDLTNFEKLHVGSGGHHILSSLNMY